MSYQGYQGYQHVGEVVNLGYRSYDAQSRMDKMQIFSEGEYGYSHQRQRGSKSPMPIYVGLGVLLFLLLSTSHHSKSPTTQVNTTVVKDLVVNTLNTTILDNRTAAFHTPTDQTLNDVNSDDTKASALQESKDTRLDHKDTSISATKGASSMEECIFPSTFRHDANNFTYLDSTNFCGHETSLEECSCSNPTKPSARNVPGWDQTRKLNIGLANQSIASKTALDVVMVGDGIIELWNGREWGNFSGRQNYSLAFQKLFQKQNGSKIEGLALGFAGDQTQNLLYRLQNGEMPHALQPKVWWILIGTNNLGLAHCNADAIVAGNIRVAEEIRKHSPDAKIVINSLLPRGGEELLHRSLYWKVLKQVNRQLACYTNQQNNLYFFNATEYFVYNETSEIHGGEIFVNKTLMPDFLHPSGYGAQKWGSGIVEEVLQLTA